MNDIESILRQMNDKINFQSTLIDHLYGYSLALASILEIASENGSLDFDKSKAQALSISKLDLVRGLKNVDVAKTIAREAINEMK